MVDARRMEVYTQMFDAKGQSLNEVKAEIIAEDSFAEWRNGRPFVIFGNGAAKCQEVLKDAILVNVTPSARGLAALAHQRFEAGQTEDIAYFEPFYLKDFIVIPSKKKLL
jgi:tRNA threonylcarbamoyladenosine biosynthesis protein TsaB